MASLKEVKTRINSVKSTRKITSAMKMVASAKLHKAPEGFPYSRYKGTSDHEFETGILSGKRKKTSSQLTIEFD